MAKPFLKWAGGKGQLLSVFDGYFPPELGRGKVRRYVEPMVGGGAVFFHVASRFNVDELLISDIGEEVICAYETLQKGVEGVIASLKALEATYLSCSTETRKSTYYAIREEFNDSRRLFNPTVYSDQWITRTAQLIFLNRTCFNGLYRVNSRGAFNVPHGDYKNPKICDAANLRAIAQVLARTEIRRGDYTTLAGQIQADTFAYFDPPYRPISKTSSFTSYQRSGFDDAEQIRLASFFVELNAGHARLMLSNSDPSNTDPSDSFFDDIYRHDDFHISRIPATRIINSNASRRGAINEIVVTNYLPPRPFVRDPEYLQDALAIPSATVYGEISQK